MLPFLRIGNLIVLFIVEVAMLAAFAYFGFYAGNTILVKTILGIGIPGSVIAIWGYWAAPKSAHRLKMPNLIVFRLALFLLSALALYQTNQSKLAIVMAIFSVITQAMCLATENNE